MEFKKYFKSDQKFIIILLLFSMLRLYIGYYAPVWFRLKGRHDDLLLLSYSHLSTHFLNWNILSLTKTMSYPLFLFVVRISHIPYTVWLSLLWIIAGLIVIYALYKFVSKNKILLTLSFIFITFLPIAFDVFSGLRIYRNAIMAPMALISLSSLFIFVQLAISKNKDNKLLIVWAIICGLLFTFNFYIKEDGILTFPIFIVSLISIILYKFYELRSKKIIKIALICLIPLLIFASSTFAYAEINNHYFGVNEINTRTGGEIGKFWQNLIKIDDENKNTTVWVPESTLYKAWNASPTLQSHPELLEQILTWYPVEGDHLSWNLRDSLNEVGLFENEQEANNYFYKVNNELNDAFDSGKLNKSDKIFITSSADGKSLSQIQDIGPFITSGIECCVLYKYIDFGNSSFDSSRIMSNNRVKDVENDLNQHLVTQNEIDNPSITQKLAFDFIKFDIGFYQIISYIIVIVSLASFLASIKIQFTNKFKNRENNAIIGFEFLLLATFILQIFAIGWFCSWLDPVGSMKYYTVANQGIFALFEVLAILGFIKIYSTINSEKNYLNGLLGKLS